MYGSYEDKIKYLTDTIPELYVKLSNPELNAEYINNKLTELYEILDELKQDPGVLIEYRYELKDIENDLRYIHKKIRRYL